MNRNPAWERSVGARGRPAGLSCSSAGLIIPMILRAALGRCGRVIQRFLDLRIGSGGLVEELWLHGWCVALLFLSGGTLPRLLLLFHGGGFLGLSRSGIIPDGCRMQIQLGHIDGILGRNP